MDLLDYLRRLLTYDRWANREVLASLQAIPTPPAQSVRLFAHIVGAESLWLDRLRRRPSSLPVWPASPLVESAAHLTGLERAWQEYLGTLTGEALAHSIPYTNSKGEAFTNAVRDILGHVAAHSAYHRGQIASDVRAEGGTPAYTDFIHAVRQGFTP